MSALARDQQLRAKYENASAPTIEHEDRLDVEEAQEIWNDIYAQFGASGEAAQTNVKVAVYGYYAVNAASKRTPHKRDITTTDGTTVAAADVLRVIGADRLRQFLRADVSDAYFALKMSDVILNDEVFCARVKSEKGVPASIAYVAVDFLRGCPNFTPEEAKYAEKAFLMSIERASSSRKGATIEEEDGEAALARAHAGYLSRRGTSHNGVPADEF